MYSVVLVLGLALGARPAAAQQIFKPAVLDSVQQSIQRPLYALRDTLNLVDAAMSRLARDRRVTSDALLRARARLIAERCQAADPASSAAREAILKAGRPDPDKGKVLPTLTESLTQLKREMAACALEFKGLALPDSAERLRDYGVGRLPKIQGALRRYEMAVKPYFAVVIGDRYMPSTEGAGATPSGP